MSLIFLGLSSTELKAEVIECGAGASLNVNGNSPVSHTLLCLGRTTGKAYTGLTKANFIFLGSKDLWTNANRSISFTVAPLSVPGAYKLTVTPVGWSHCTTPTATGCSRGIMASWKVTANGGVNNGGTVIGTVANMGLGF